MSQTITLPTETTYAIWMRCPTSSGGKDWIGCLTTSSVVTIWGPTGNLRQSKQLASRSDVFLLDEKKREKLNKGYKEVAAFDPNKGWYSLDPRIPLPASLPFPSGTGTKANTSTPVVLEEILLYKKSSREWVRLILWTNNKLDQYEWQGAPQTLMPRDPKWQTQYDATSEMNIAVQNVIDKRLNLGFEIVRGQAPEMENVPRAVPMGSIMANWLSDSDNKWF